MNVLIIAPHPDDEAIGCGGTLCLHVDAGDRVAVTFLTSGELGLEALPKEEAWSIREAEAQAAGKILGVSQIDFLRLRDWHVGEEIEAAALKLAPVLFREKPSLIFLPHPSEWHPDHRASLPVVKAALAMQSTTEPWRTPDLLSYEVWTPLSEHDGVEDITATMTRKLCAVRKYRSQLEAFRYDRAVKGLNQYRGIMSGHCRFAEAFQTIEDEEIE